MVSWLNGGQTLTNRRAELELIPGQNSFISATEENDWKEIAQVGRNYGETEIWALL